MNDDLETEALHYLLDEMDAGRRAAFEERLARDPAARDLVKACADAMARFATETAPAEPMTASDQRVALAAILASTGASKRGTPVPTAVVPWPRWVWPAAAAVLLGLNLLDFERPLAPGGVERDAPTRPVAREGRVEANKAAETLASSKEASDVAAADAKTGAESAPTAPRVRSEAEEMARQFAKLRSDYANLQRTATVLRAEYDSLVRHFADRVLMERSVGRLAAMELVDVESYERGERRGLVDVARGILTAPGVVVPLESDPETPPGQASVGVATPQSAPPEPYAWAVFDDQEHRGYLNLYNLPRVAADQSLQLWVKTTDAVEFQRVGEVPETLHGGGGTVQYTLPETSSAPAEILVTVEPKAATSEQPTGPTVLRGP